MICLILPIFFQLLHHLAPSCWWHGWGHRHGWRPRGWHRHGWRPCGFGWWHRPWRFDVVVVLLWCDFIKVISFIVFHSSSSTSVKNPRDFAGFFLAVSVFPVLSNLPPFFFLVGKNNRFRKHIKFKHHGLQNHFTSRVFWLQSLELAPCSEADRDGDAMLILSSCCQDSTPKSVAGKTLPLEGESTIHPSMCLSQISLSLIFFVVCRSMSMPTSTSSYTPVLIALILVAIFTHMSVSKPTSTIANLKLTNITI